MDQDHSGKSQIISERGFVVLRYDKRGVGENPTIIDAYFLENTTIHKLQNDADPVDGAAGSRQGYHTHRT